MLQDAASIHPLRLGRSCFPSHRPASHLYWAFRFGMVRILSRGMTNLAPPPPVALASRSLQSLLIGCTMLCQAMGEKQEASSAAPSEKAEGETGNLKPDSAGGKI